MTTAAPTVQESHTPLEVSLGAAFLLPKAAPDRLTEELTARTVR